MYSEYIKLIAPFGFFTVWCFFALKTRRAYLAGAALFFTSIVACSQNFSFIYREIHQLIQFLMISVALIFTCLSWKILKFNVVFSGLIFFITLSFLFVPLDSDAKSQLVNIAAVIGVVNYLYLSLKLPEDMKILMDYIALLSVLLACLGIAEYLLAPGIRAEGTMSNPNYFGYFLGIGFCIVSVQVSGLSRWVALAVIVFGILACGSRSAFALPLLQALWAAYRSGSFRKALLYVTIGSIVIVSMLVLNITRFSDVDASQGSDAERIIFAGIAFRMANDHPLTGVGWGRYISEFSNYSTTAENLLTDAGAVDVSGQDRRVTHNDLVRILAELGWVAFFASISVCISGLVKIIRWKGFGVDYIFGIWAGTVLFSMAHNNLNGGFFWFFFLLPFYLHQNKISLKDVYCFKAKSITYHHKIFNRITREYEH